MNNDFEYDSGIITKKTRVQTRTENYFNIFLIIFILIMCPLTLILIARSFVYHLNNGTLVGVEIWMFFTIIPFALIFLMLVAIFGGMAQPRVKQIIIFNNKMKITQRNYLKKDTVTQLDLSETTYCYSNENPSKSFPMIVIIYLDNNGLYQTLLIDKKDIPEFERFINIVKKKVNFDSEKHVIYMDARKMCKELNMHPKSPAPSR